MQVGQLESRVEKIRHFNRFYTRQIGLLNEHLLQSKFSLTEARILYELAHRSGITATDLCRELGLNAGYLSRVVSGFEKQGLVKPSRSVTDKRVVELRLTAKGRAAFRQLDDASRREVAAMLQRLSVPEQHQLVEAMEQIEALLGERHSSSYVLRDPQPGDLGWVVHRHGVLYSQEYGWNLEFEALVLGIVAQFVRNLDRSCERCWIAEKDGKVVGSVFIIRHDAATAKLRLLYVEPSARGMGIGKRLVEECVRFARLAGYKKIVLWTNSILHAARRIYEQTGFRKIEETPHRSFGKELVGETWVLDL